eukprot:GHVU01036676.1.p1 GENE.GHVU01036676.1~~GHVU01036676.1.p1  ORF type:complete len:342 (-),score=35.58 GHVU01036676.1:18-1043(-)
MLTRVRVRRPATVGSRTHPRMPACLLRAVSCAVPTTPGNLGVAPLPHSVCMSACLPACMSACVPDGRSVPPGDEALAASRRAVDLALDRAPPELLQFLAAQWGVGDSEGEEGSEGGAGVGEGGGGEGGEGGERGWGKAGENAGLRRIRAELRAQREAPRYFCLDVHECDSSDRYGCSAHSSVAVDCGTIPVAATAPTAAPTTTTTAAVAPATSEGNAAQRRRDSVLHSLAVDVGTFRSCRLSAPGRVWYVDAGIGSSDYGESGNPTGRVGGVRRGERVAPIGRSRLTWHYAQHHPGRWATAVDLFVPLKPRISQCTSQSVSQSVTQAGRQSPSCCRWQTGE